MYWQILQRVKGQRAIRLLSMILLLPCFAAGQYQNLSDSLKNLPDSIIIHDSITKSASKVPIKTSDTSVSYLIQRVEQFTMTLNQYNYALKRGFDTAFVSDQLPSIEDDIQIIHNDINSYTKRMNLRNLYATRVLLTQIQLKLKEWQGLLFRYYNQLVDMNQQLREMRNDSILRNLPADSTLKNFYFSQLVELRKKWVKADSVNKTNLRTIGLLQSRIASKYLETNDLLEEVNFRTKSIGREILRDHDGYIWQASPGNYPVPFSQVIRKSYKSLIDVLKYYIPLSWDTRLFNIFLFLVFYFWISFNIKKIKKNSTDAENILKYAEFAGKYPLVSSLVFILTLAPFIYKNPPASYMLLLGIATFFLLTELLWLEWPRVLHKYWIATGVLFLICSLSNILIENSFFERWMMLVVSILTIILAVLIRNVTVSPSVKYPKLTRFLLYLLIVMNSLSIIANISGRFALAKLLTTSSILSFFLAINLTFFVEIVMDAIYLQAEAGKNYGTNSYYYFNYAEIRHKLRNTLMIVAGGFWVVGFSQSLNFYNFFCEWIMDFLNKQRRVGNTSFNFGSILIFIIVIWISTLISKLIAYFFADKPVQGGIRKSKLGNLMLLVRLAVLSAGILFAFAASGIPLDKLAIVIGALGVGIGFGLQNVVNNLVSGVILAFEKPIEIGDQIEVGPRSGTVKEIGIRSSKITTADGSEVIIPNGDLLSQHIVNWTLNNRNRRIEVLVGVAYGSDLQVVKKIMEESMINKHDIMPNPAPVILINGFGDNSVNFRLLFWTSDIDQSQILRSEVMDSIYTKLNEAGVEIPFPQRDLHIKSMDDKLWQEWKDKIGGNNEQKIPPKL